MSDSSPATLEDGSAPATATQLLQRLANLGIDVHTVEHAAVFTVQEAKELRGELPGGHTKNLFLRNKKGRMWLVVCAEDQRLDLKELGRRIGAGRLSFGSPERLMRFLGVIPGAVTPFAAMNDHGGAVTVVLERSLLGAGTLNFHPLDNAKTTAIAAADLVRFLESVEHRPELCELGAAPPR